MASIKADMEVVELRDGMVICAWTSPTAALGGAMFQGAAAPLGSYNARTQVLLAELTDSQGRPPAPGRPLPQPQLGDRVHDMDDGTRVHVPKP